MTLPHRHYSPPRRGQGQKRRPQEVQTHWRRRCWRLHWPWWQRARRRRRALTTRHERHEKRREHHVHLDHALNRTPQKSPSSPRLLTPPRPPLPLNVESALDPLAPAGILWKIARQCPELRHWLIANPAASPELLEYVSQRGGPGVKEGFHVLFEDGKDGNRDA